MRRARVGNTKEERIFHFSVIFICGIVSFGMLFMVYYLFDYTTRALNTGRVPIF